MNERMKTKEAEGRERKGKGRRGGGEEGKGKGGQECLKGCGGSIPGKSQIMNVKVKRQ